MASEGVTKCTGLPDLAIRTCKVHWIRVRCARPLDRLCMQQLETWTSNGWFVKDRPAGQWVCMKSAGPLGGRVRHRRPTGARVRIATG